MNDSTTIILVRNIMEKEIEEKFKQRIEDLKKAGIYTQLFMEFRAHIARAKNALEQGAENPPRKFKDKLLEATLELDEAQKIYGELEKYMTPP